MTTVYIQHLLKVLLEEYQDIEYMLDRLEKQHPTRRDSERIHQLLSKLNQQNTKLLGRYQTK